MNSFSKKSEPFFDKNVFKTILIFGTTNPEGEFPLIFLASMGRDRERNYFHACTDYLISCPAVQIFLSHMFRDKVESSSTFSVLTWDRNRTIKIFPTCPGPFPLTPREGQVKIHLYFDRCTHIENLKSPTDVLNA